MSEIKEWHDPKFDNLLNEVHGFFDKQGIRPLPLARAAIASIVTQEMWSQKPHLPPLQSEPGGLYEGYHVKTRQLLVIAPPEECRPQTREVYLNILLAHGLTHSVSLSESEGSNYFYNEAIAGIGEFAWLQHLEKAGIFKPANPIRLKRAGVSIVVPANRRFLHKDEVDKIPLQREARSRTTTGMLASLAVEECLEDSEDSTDILRSSHPKAAIRNILNRRQRGLADKIDQLPDDMNGIVQKLAMIQNLD